MSRNIVEIRFGTSTELRFGTSTDGFAIFLFFYFGRDSYQCPFWYVDGAPRTYMKEPADIPKRTREHKKKEPVFYFTLS